MTTLAPLVHALAGPFVDPASRTWAPALALAAIVAIALGGSLRAAWAIVRHPSSVLDAQLFVVRRLAAAALPIGGGAGAVGLAVAIARALDAALGRPELAVPPAAIAALTAIVTFVVSDASRYVLHRAMHRIPALWAFHQVHHGAEVLTPLTLYRVHPVEGLLFGLRGTLVLGTLGGLSWWAFRDAGAGAILGVSAVGFVLNGLVGNLRHSHVAWGFGRLERWLLSPAQHQVHHAVERACQGSNFGVWLACWDRWGGTWRASAAVAAFGLDPADRNHDPRDLWSVLVGPLRRPAWLVAALAVGRTAGAAEPVEIPPVDAPPGDDVVAEDDDGAIIVTDDAGKVSVPGAAAVIGEDELDRYAYDDVHRVLAKVPGVYTRGEDGFGLRPNIGIRGANSDRSSKVALMEDGVLFGPAPYAAPAAYYFPLPLRLVGVEVFKGAAATRFGPNTVGGAINLRTREVPTDGLAGAFDLAGGMFATTRGHGWIGVGDDRRGVLLELAHLGTTGFKDLDGGGSTGFQREDVMLKARVGGATDDLELKLGAGRERSHETYTGLSPADFAATPYRRYAASADDLMRWWRTEAELAWTVRHEGLTVRTVAYHHRLSRQWTKLNRFAGGPDLHDLLGVDAFGQAGVYQAILRGEADTASPDQVLMIGTNDRRFHAFGVQSVATWSVAGDRLASKLETGLRLHGDLVDRVHTEDPTAMTDGALVPTGDARLVLLDQQSAAFALAAHVAEDLMIGDLRVLPGVRVEAIRGIATDAGAATVATTRVVPLPGLGAIYDPGPTWDLFAGVHRGFTPVAPGQPKDVSPELSWNFEAGARADGEAAHAEVTAFYVDYQNIAGVCTVSAGCDADELDRQFNGGRAQVAGAEVATSAEAALPAEITLGGELSYTLTWSAFATAFDSDFDQFGSVDVGDHLPYVPMHQGAARATFTHPRVELAFAANYRGAMRDVAGQGKIEDRVKIPASFTLDVTATAPIGPWSVYATCTNVTNRVNLEGMRPFGLRPGAPRLVMVGLRGRWG